MTTSEREITAPVDLCDARGHLHPDARGWARHPMLRANLKARAGRKKRWDYWNVNSDEVVVGMTFADIDYAGLANVWVMEHATAFQASAGVLRPFGKGLVLPEQVCTGTMRYTDKAFRLQIDETDERTRLRASGTSPHGQIEVDVEVAKPSGHESLNVVIPWSDRTFQFTSKQNTRPATGTVRVGEQEWTLDAGHEAWGTQDLGRGIWPYANRWNWAAASGHSDGHLVGLQFGGKWTVGTGATENALCVDGVLSKVGEELEWTYDWDHPMAPWRVRTPMSDQVDVTLTPTFDRWDSTDLKVLKMQVHQCFGTWSGRIVTDDGTAVQVDGIRGFAEEARNRW